MPGHTGCMLLTEKRKAELEQKLPACFSPNKSIKYHQQTEGGQVLQLLCFWNRTRKNPHNTIGSAKQFSAYRNFLIEYKITFRIYPISMPMQIIIDNA